VNDAGTGPKALQKAPTGIQGFDDISSGGLPRGRTTLILGGAGTGKTVFALQSLTEGYRRFGEPGLFVAFEESTEQVLTNSASFGWDLSRDVGIGFFDAHLSPDSVRSGDFDLSALLTEVEVKARALGAKRIVFDAIDVMLSLMGDRQREIMEVHRVRNWLDAHGLTGIITSRGSNMEAAECDPEGLAEAGFLPFVADCVIVVRRRIQGRIALRNLQILKYRGSRHGQNEYSFVIGPTGIELSGLALAESKCPVSTERISTGIPRLDRMLNGGYYRGTSTIVTGAPGTAKTTLGVAFADACCRRGERILYLAFDESAEELVRNFDAIGFDLQRHIDAGLLRILAARAEARSADEFVGLWQREEAAWRPTGMVIDPFSALLKAGGEVAAIMAATEMIRVGKAEGITIVATSLTGAVDPLEERAEIHVSTVADNWIHLSFAVQAGERNRALTIIKARGIGHSRQVRELVISDRGVDLADVYAAGGGVVMGTLRIEKETADEADRERLRLEMEAQRREFEAGEAETRARMVLLENELEARRAAFDILSRRHQAVERLWEAQRQVAERLRGADEQ
jgi:circadian clock protein KaiC